MNLNELNSELLFEAKAKFRDAKGTRDKAINWVLEQGEPFIEKATKDAALINGLVATLAKVAGKKMKAGKYSLTDADMKKIATAKFTVHNLGKPTFKKITSFAGGGKPHAAAAKAETTTTKSAPTAKKAEDVIETIKSAMAGIGGSCSSSSCEWETEERDSARSMFRVAERKLPNDVAKFFKNSPQYSTDEEDPYHDPEWSDFAQWQRNDEYEPKPEYADKLSRLIVGGRDTGDYSGDYAQAYIIVRFK